MAIESSRVSVGTSATLLYAHPLTTSSSEGDFGAKHVALLNVSSTPITVAVGPAGVTTTSGARWVTGLGLLLTLDLEPGEAVYGVVATGTQEIDVLVNGR